MKKLIFIMLITTLFGWSAFAQSKFSIEIIAQPQFSSVGDFQIPDGNNILGNSNTYVTMNNDMRFGVETGVQVGYDINEQFKISLGLLYSNQGQKYDYSTSMDYMGIPIDYSWQRTLSLNYLKIPVLLHYNQSPDKTVSFGCYAGFYLGFLLGYNDQNTVSISTFGLSETPTTTAKGNTFTTTDSSGTNIYTFINKPYNSVDFGLCLGAGVVIKLTDNISLPIMLNYEIGFVNFKNTGSSYTTSNSTTQLYWDTNDPNSTINYHNSLWGLRIGLDFKLQ